MIDYSQYKYERLLNYLNKSYEDSADKTNYATVLLGMQDATSIKECLSICDKVRYKYSKGYYYYDKGYDEELAICLNDNLMRLMQSNHQISAEEVLANLRPCDDLEKYQKEIISCGSSHTQKTPSEFEQTANKIISAQKTYLETSDKIESQKEGTNGWKNSKKLIKESFEILKENGYIKNKTNIEIENENQWIFYILAALIIIVLIYAFGGLALLILPWLGLKALLK